MAKYIATVSFWANIEIEADDADEARIKAEDIQDTRSVYADDVVQGLHDQAYCAGGMGEDPPLHKDEKAYHRRDHEFFAGDVEVMRKEGE